MLIGIAIAGITLTGCPPFILVDPSPTILVPALNRVYEGERYNYQMQISGQRPLKYSIKTTPILPASLEKEINLSVNSSGLVTGDIPQVDKDTDYNVEIDISNNYGTAEQNYVLHVLDKNLPPNTK